MEIDVLGLVLKLMGMLTKLPTHNCKIFAKKQVQTETSLKTS